MIKEVVVEVEERAERGSNASGRIRRAGQVPGIVYGLGLEPFAVAVSPRRIEDVLRLESGRNTIFTLRLAGQERSRAVMIRELQRDPVTERLVHVDFVRVDLDKRIRVSVPVRLLGTPEGVKNEGGTIEFVNRQVEVECLPAAIPQHLDVDITDLHINQHVSVADLSVSADVRILDEPETILCVVAPPRVEEAPPAEAAEAAPAAEPEVIKRGKEAAEESTGESKK